MPMPVSLISCETRGIARIATDLRYRSHGTQDERDRCREYHRSPCDPTNNEISARAEQVCEGRVHLLCEESTVCEYSTHCEGDALMSA